MPSPEAENLIAQLSHVLAPAAAFRRTAESALDTPQCWEPGLIHRTVTAVWRNYFRPPSDRYIAAWERTQHEMRKRRLTGCASTATSPTGPTDAAPIATTAHTIERTDQGAADADVDRSAPQSARVDRGARGGRYGRICGAPRHDRGHTRITSGITEPPGDRKFSGLLK